jgi:hypothetical protein
MALGPLPRAALGSYTEARFAASDRDVGEELPESQTAMSPPGSGRSCG